MSGTRTLLATALATVIVGAALPVAAQPAYPKHYTGATQAKIASVQARKIASTTRGITRTTGNPTVAGASTAGLNLAYPVHYWGATQAKIDAARAARQTRGLGTLSRVLGHTGTGATEYPARVYDLLSRW